MSRVSKSIEQVVVARGCREWEWQVNTKEYGAAFWEDENILNLDRGDGCTTLNTLKATELYTLTGDFMVCKLSLSKIVFKKRGSSSYTCFFSFLKSFSGTVYHLYICI